MLFSFNVRIPEKHDVFKIRTKYTVYKSSESHLLKTVPKSPTEITSVIMAQLYGFVNTVRIDILPPVW
jgi:hypothetical protein